MQGQWESKPYLMCVHACVCMCVCVHVCVHVCVCVRARSRVLQILGQWVQDGTFLNGLAMPVMQEAGWHHTLSMGVECRASQVWL